MARWYDVGTNDLAMLEWSYMAENRDTMGRFRAGHPGGPGRPRNGVRAALARIVDFDELASYVYRLATDPKAPAKERLQAIEWITDRLEGRAVQALSMSIQTATSGLPDDWHQLSPEAQEQYLDGLRAKALEGGK